MTLLSVALLAITALPFLLLQSTAEALLQPPAQSGPHTRRTAPRRVRVSAILGVRGGGDVSVHRTVRTGAMGGEGSGEASALASSGAAGSEASANSADVGALPLFEAKMRAAGQSEAAIRAFGAQYVKLVRGESGLIREADILPATSVPSFADVLLAAAATTGAPPGESDAELLGQTVVLKLNGGLGTGMGLQGPKSLLAVREGPEPATFLDLIVRQLRALARQVEAQAPGSGARPPLLVLLNSGATSAATRAHLQTQQGLAEGAGWRELLQSMAPKVLAASLAPAQAPESLAPAVRESLEWYPPGHGDLFSALAASPGGPGAESALDALIRLGYRYCFVSNADNLGATLEVALLRHFRQSGSAFTMEVCARTESDRKGGHLALSADGQRLLLRESAQCAPEDASAFQDTQRHGFFNTNNVWLHLPRLQQELRRRGGLLALPLIRNAKTLDPRDKASPGVVQLETAMGAAIEAFGAEASALLVPRSRFSPVKTCADLLALRSDCYELHPESASVRLSPLRAAMGPPVLSLDESFYKNCDDFERLTPEGAPSLLRCRRLTVKGPVAFARGCVFEGEVSVSNAAAERKVLPAGVYTDTEISL